MNRGTAVATGEIQQQADVDERTKTIVLLVLLVVGLVVFAPFISAKDFLVQNQTQHPLLTVNGTSSNVGIGLLNPSAQLEVGGDTVFGGNIDLRNNDMVNFFSSNCGPNEVVNRIWANGTYQCVSIAGSQNLSEVLAHGNVANTSINMDGNNIDNVGTLNAGGSTVALGGDLQTAGNNLTSSTGNVTVATDLKVYGELWLRGSPGDGANTNLQNLSEVLVHGNVANTSINMDNNEVQNVVSNSAGDAVNRSWVNDNDDVQDADADPANELQNLSEVLVHGAVANQSINMANNNLTNVRQIQNFFATACGPGEVVEQVFADGSYQCTAIDEEVTDTWVNASGDTMTGRLNMSNNSINNISVLHEFGETLRIGGQVAMQSNRITGLADPTSAQDAATKSWVEQKAGAYNQTIEEVLREGNNANGRSIVNVGALDLQNGLLTGNISDNAITPAKLDNTGNFDMNSLSLSVGLNTGNISDNAITSAKINTDAVTNTELDNTGNFDVNSLSVAQALLDGNVSDSISINNGPLYAQNGGSNVGIGTTSPGTLLTVDGDAEVRGDLDVWGNITNTDVQNLNVNGSLLPPADYDATFDVGASGRRWQDGRFANNLLINGSIHIDGNVDGVDIDNPGNAITISGQQYTVNTADSTLTVSGGLDVNGDVIGANELVYAYETGQAFDSRFVNASGDTMSGDLAFNTNAISNVGSGKTNITATGAIEAGGNIDVDNNEVQNVLSNSGGDAVNQSYVQDYVSNNNDDADSDPTNELQNLSEVLTHGNEANQTVNMTGDDIDMRGGSVKSSQGEVCIGDQCA